MIKSAIAALSVLSVIALAGCKQIEDVGPTEAPWVGEYTVSKISSQALPWAIPEFTCDYAVTSGSIALRSTHKVDGTMGFRYDCKTGGVSAPVQGQWTIKGDWRVEGGELLYITDAQPNRDLGPVLSSGHKDVESTTVTTISLDSQIQDCTGLNKGACKQEEAVLTLTR